MLTSSPEVEEIIKNAANLASDLNHSYVTVEHLSMALLTWDNFKNCVANFGVDIENLLLELDIYLQKQTHLTNHLETTPQKTYALKRVFN